MSGLSDYDEFMVPDWEPKELEDAYYGELKWWNCPHCGHKQLDYEGTWLLMCENCDEETSWDEVLQ